MNKDIGRKIKYSLDFSLEKGRTDYYDLYMEYPDTVTVASYPEFLHLSYSTHKSPPRQSGAWTWAETVFWTPTKQRCELKIEQGNNSPAHSDMFRKAAIGNAHAGLIRKVEHLKRPFFSSLTCAFQSHETPFLISPALGVSVNRRERVMSRTQSLAFFWPENRPNWSMKLVSLS